MNSTNYTSGRAFLLVAVLAAASTSRLALLILELAI